MDSILPTLQVFSKKTTQSTGTASTPKETQTLFPFVPLLFKPQDGAVVPFETNASARQPETRSNS